MGQCIDSTHHTYSYRKMSWCKSFLLLVFCSVFISTQARSADRDVLRLTRILAELHRNTRMTPYRLEHTKTEEYKYFNGEEYYFLDACDGFYSAAYYGHLEAMRTILSDVPDLDVNCVSAEYKSQPLFAAVRKNNLEIVKFLLEHGAKADILFHDS